MGMLGNLLGALGGGDSRDNPIGAIVQMLGQHEGGLGGLVDQFHQNGMGDVMNSWLQTGPNPPIGAEQLKNIFSNDQIGGLAEKFGVDHNQAASILAEYLPGIIDKLSPQGSLPQGNEWISTAATVLGGLLRR
jgi:uncharacterized protein YidB (DUF937 family)